MNQNPARAENDNTKPEPGESKTMPSEPISGKDFDAFVDACLKSMTNGHDGTLPPSDDDRDAAQALWAFAQRRADGERPVRVYNLTADGNGGFCTDTIVETFGSDMPFLLDSLLAVLNESDIEIRKVVHPVVSISRDQAGGMIGLAENGAENAGRESFIQVHIEPLIDPERLSGLSYAISMALQDVEAAVKDWQPMLSAIDEAGEGLGQAPSSLDKDDVSEVKEFLSWLRVNNFTFLGCRDYEVREEGGEPHFKSIPESGLGLLRDADKRVVWRDDQPSAVKKDFLEHLLEPFPLVIAKANAKSTVHRPAFMDYIGVKKFDSDGRVVGERRFVGLFTSAAYNRSPLDIPLLRRKVENTLVRAGFSPASHDGKALVNILEIYPRDELFQVSEDELFHTALGMLRLEERPQTKLFVRRDQFDRFVSAIVYVPRDRYATELRTKIADILCDTYGGRLLSFYPRFTDEPLARIHFNISRDPMLDGLPDHGRVEAAIVEASRSWQDRLRQVINERFDPDTARTLFAKYRGAFNAAYRESIEPEGAVDDLVKIETLSRDGDIGARLHHNPIDGPTAFRLRIYHAGPLLVLSDYLPILEKLGLKVLDEQSYPIRLSTDKTISLHTFRFELKNGQVADIERIESAFEDTFLAVWNGYAEGDGFNALVVAEGMPWRDVTVIRAVAKYMRQIGVSYSQDYLEATLQKHSQVTKLLAALFASRFSPEISDRDTCVASVRGAIQAELDRIESLDEDRILRGFLNVIESTLRTNFYQCDAAGAPKDYIAFKIDSGAISEMPLPRPHVEIFVYSPRVEGVHLRFGKVARGGLRWSDRPEDFRTEVLGLVKAQQVKNTVIVPVGSKGGFVPKKLPITTDREALQEEAIACYKMFIGGLLDVTDNLIEGTVVPPQNVIRHDDDDPYLVVAADKGTATFSDIANGVAVERGFWLGDAFASGGSNGYDHKKMGITAKGAWEAVKRHFREMGIDTQTMPFTVVGVGDMSGDVFGNGMLLSEQIKLVAAFDHRDIFIDPDPDPAKGFAERKRLFGLPRTSWQDYDASLISKGGGIFKRSAKSITLTPEIQALTGLAKKDVPPNELIQALIKAQIDLLWFGGIGTYIKSSEEANNAVGDKANEALRVDGGDVRARVIGEGANLGLTQRGRIEYAKAGGRINTDAIDNAAGVDCSDHEVNIKILLNGLVSGAHMDMDARNALLESMDDDVSSLVLKNNYRQTLALTVSRATAPADVGAQTRLMRAFERSGDLDRAVEFLPDDETLAELERSGQGLTRPEMAVLMAYSKNTLYDALLASSVPDDSQFERDLSEYFPGALRNTYSNEIAGHQLRREIIATELANVVVNTGGSTFVARMKDETGATAEATVRAYMVVRNAYGLDRLYDEINALDNQIPAELQTTLHLYCKTLLRRQSMWFLQNGPAPLAIENAIDEFGPGITALRETLFDHISDFQKERTNARKERLIERGAPEALAHAVASLEPLSAAPDIILVAKQVGRTIDEVACTHFSMGAYLGFDRLKASADTIGLEDHWERLALARTMDDLAVQQRVLTAQVLQATSGSVGDQAINEWAEGAGTAVQSLREMIGDLEAGGLNMAKISVAASQMRRLTSS